MRLVAQPDRNTDHFEAALASMRGWVIGLLAWFADTFDHLPPVARRNRALRAWVAHVKGRVGASLRFSGRALRLFLIASAYARLTIPAAGAREKLYPGRDPRGVRRARQVGHFYRCVTGGVLTGLQSGSLRQRAERLRALLSTIETLIARVLKRLQAMFAAMIAPALKLTHSQDVFARFACTQACACADTS